MLCTESMKITPKRNYSERNLTVTLTWLPRTGIRFLSNHEQEIKFNKFSFKFTQLIYISTVVHLNVSCLKPHLLRIFKSWLFPRLRLRQVLSFLVQLSPLASPLICVCIYTFSAEIFRRPNPLRARPR